MPAELIKRGGAQLLKQIRELIEVIWIKETIPDKWPRKILTTLPKKGDLLNCVNCRTVTSATYFECHAKPDHGTEIHLSEDEVDLRTDRSSKEFMSVMENSSTSSRINGEKRKKERRITVKHKSADKYVWWLNYVGGNRPVGLPRELPAARCLVDNTPLYRNSRHIFSRQNFREARAPKP